MQQRLFIQAYRTHIKAWVAQYRSNVDPEHWESTFFWGKFERTIMEEICGFEEEKWASRRLDPEMRPLRDTISRINRAAEKVCKAHYAAHELEYTWPLPPQDLDQSPRPVPEGWEPKCAGMEQVLVVGQLLLSWHTSKYGGIHGTRTYYTVSLSDGRHILLDRWVWNSALPRARKPHLRHARALEVVQELSRMVSWKDYAGFSNKQRRALEKRVMEIGEKVGRLGE